MPERSGVLVATLEGPTWAEMRCRIHVAERGGRYVALLNVATNMPERSGVLVEGGRWATLFQHDRDGDYRSGSCVSDVLSLG